MEKRFQYILTGVGLTLLLIIGVLAIVSSQVQADQPTNTSLVQVDEAVDNQTNIPIVTNDSSEGVAEEESSQANSEISVESNSSDIAQDTQLAIQENEKDHGSQTVPQTDFDVITGQIIELTDRYSLNFLSQPGWTHLQYQSFVPVSTKGNGLESYGIETTQFFPDDVTIEDYWFNENDSGYGQEVHHVSDATGNPLQRIASIDGTTINLTLKALGVPTTHYRFSAGDLQNPVSATQERITYVLREMSQSAGASAWLEGDQYTIVVIDKFSEPLQLTNAPEPYVAHRYQVILNWETGAIQYEEFAFQTPSEEWLIMESRTNFFIEVVRELPTTASQTLEEVNLLLQEEN
jgi:hypothetical protein